MEWRDIETAPKDGTQVLVHSPDGYAIAAWSSETRGPDAFGSFQKPGWMAWANGIEVGDGGLDNASGFALALDGADEWALAAPTHWMPLPEPPVCNASGDEAIGKMEA